MVCMGCSAHLWQHLLRWHQGLLWWAMAQVGLIIDLTNSWRYYDLEEVTSLGVAHLKIMCRGRGKVNLPLPTSCTSCQSLGHRHGQMHNTDGVLMGPGASP